MMLATAWTIRGIDASLSNDNAKVLDHADFGGRSIFNEGR